MSSEPSVVLFIKPAVTKSVAFHSQVLHETLIWRYHKGLCHTEQSGSLSLNQGFLGSTFRKSEAIHITMSDIHKPYKLLL